jgi:ACS family glucarate transporter-like MFS transporter
MLMLLGMWWSFFIALTATIPRHAGHALLMLIAIRFALGAGEATMYPATSSIYSARDGSTWVGTKERGVFHLVGNKAMHF